MTKSIVLSITLKGLQAFFGFTIIHRLISGWGTDQYGVWIIMTSAITYMMMLDFGVGYGIKNRISEAAAQYNPQSHAALLPIVQFGMSFYALVAAAILAIGMAVIPTVAPFKNHPLAAAMLWTASAGVFFLSYANVVLQGEGRFVLLNSLTLVTPTTWCMILILTRNSGLLTLTTGALIYGGLLLAQGSLAFMMARRFAYFRVWPILSWDVSVIRPLLVTGAKFFLLQIASLTLFSSGNFIIFHELGPADVAYYDAATKVFSLFTVGFSMLLAVAWTEISKAKARRDSHRLRAVLGFLSIASVLMFVASALVSWQSSFIVSRLTGVNVGWKQTAPFALLVGTQSLAFSGAVFLNAFEELVGQLSLALLSVPLFFATAHFLLGKGIGMESIPLATAATMIPTVFYCWGRALAIVRRLDP